MPRHIEQPASRHSNPASLKTWSSPSCSACNFTSPEPGTTIAVSVLAILRPFTIAAAARRSSIREFVQDPRKMRSSLMSWMAVPGSRPMYTNERSASSFACGFAASSGEGTRPVTGTLCAGVVPQVTCGSMSAPFRFTYASNSAPSSVGRERQESSAFSQSEPLGACFRPSI